MLQEKLIVKIKEGELRGVVDSFGKNTISHMEISFLESLVFKEIRELSTYNIRKVSKSILRKMYDEFNLSGKDVKGSVLDSYFELVVKDGEFVECKKFEERFILANILEEFLYALFDRDDYMDEYKFLEATYKGFSVR